MREITNIDEFDFVDDVLASILYKSDVSFGHATKTFAWDKIAFGCLPHLAPAKEHPELFRFYVSDQDNLIIIRKETL